MPIISLAELKKLELVPLDESSRRPTAGLKHQFLLDAPLVRFFNGILSKVA